ncbi:MAG: hypothetical protein M3365_11790, partial [Gemmatimonadota bacterium]|nr:hypothetical protein [Gemmatimonadota bacterium]
MRVSIPRIRLADPYIRAFWHIAPPARWLAATGWFVVALSLASTPVRHSVVAAAHGRWSAALALTVIAIAAAAAVRGQYAITLRRRLPDILFAAAPAVVLLT